jgi:hypothetical protein
MNTQELNIQTLTPSGIDIDVKVEYDKDGMIWSVRQWSATFNNFIPLEMLYLSKYESSTMRLLEDRVKRVLSKETA